MKIFLGAAFVVAGFGAAACSGQSLGLGSNDAGTRASPSGSASSNGPCVSPPPPSPTPDASIAEDSGVSFDPLVGTWQGFGVFAGSVDHPPGSDSMVMTFSKGSDGSIHGTVVFGNNGTPIPPPTDPTVGYPPGTDWNHPPWITLGFPFTVYLASYDGHSVQLNISPAEAWKAWCELQTPTNEGYPCGMYRCLRNSGIEANSPQQGEATLTGPDGGVVGVVDLGKYLRCSIMSVVACSCTATACTMPITPTPTFDLQLSGTKLDGTIETGSVLSPVHFTRGP